MNMQKLNCYSIDSFNLIMEKGGILHNGSNLPNDVAVISICEPEDNRDEFYPERYFTKSQSNILLEDFDDIDGDAYYWDDCYRTVPEGFIIHNGRIIRQMTDNQADEIVKFIIDNLGKTFCIHCYAGVSRSKAVTKFIFDTFDGYTKNDCPQWGDIEIPNKYVLKKLKEAYKRYKGESN